MTIDGAIQDFRQLEYEFEHYMCDTEDKKENLMKYQKEWECYKQLAEWLEELKKLREAKPKEIPIATININGKDLRELVDEKVKEIELDIKAIRNEAIDDFVDSLDKHTQENWVEHQEYGITWNDIERIAEQLKKGVEE